MSVGLSGLTMFITGGASGIGAATARLAAGDGANVVVADIDIDAASSLAEALQEDGSQAVALHCDVSDDSSVQRAVGGAVDAFGGLDVLHNNAGVTDSQMGGTRAIDDPEFWSMWRRVSDVNVDGVLRCTIHALPHLRASPAPSIVNAGSIASHVARPRTFAYTTTKTALVGLTRALALDLAQDGIRVNAYCPGFTITDMAKTFLASAPDPEDALAGVMHNYLADEAATPEDVAQLACFLASPRSRFVNGVAWPIDGGFLAWKASPTELA